MDVHYINHEHFQEGDTKMATRFAAKLFHKNKALKVITYLVYTQTQYEPFLGEMGFKPADYKNHVFLLQNGQIQIHSIKTYKPDYLFEGREPSEVLIAVGVPPVELQRYEDKSNIAHCIIVPWLLDENKEFLSIYEAEDIETGARFPKPEETDSRIINAIRWLKSTSYPNEGYHHPNDELRLHQMANALKMYHVPVNYPSIVYGAMHNGLIPSAARKTADAFLRAQRRLFSVEKGTNYPFLKQMMEESHDDIG